jgi:serine protease Do
MQQYVTEGAGSGVVMTKDGYIMTNNHVISGANKITVTTYDNQEYSAEVIGADSTNDVAVLKIDADNLTAVTYGNSDQLSVGDLAVAIGNPLGKLGGTVTSGIISALDRQLTIDGKTMSLLQTDASINPGNSGGGLFNSDGQLIGLVVAKSSGSNIEGLGFAIPINTAADVAQQLKDNGYVSGQPTSGMSYTEATSQSMADFFTGATQSAGVYIYEVTGSNAKKAGFQSGDLVYAIDDTVISSSSDVTSIITSHEVGDKLTYTIVRGNQTKTIKLTLEEKKSDD